MPPATPCRHGLRSGLSLSGQAERYARQVVPSSWVDRAWQVTAFPVSMTRAKQTRGG